MAPEARGAKVVAAERARRATWDVFLFSRREREKESGGEGDFFFSFAFLFFFVAAAAAVVVVVVVEDGNANSSQFLPPPSRFYAFRAKISIALTSLSTLVVDGAPAAGAGSSIDDVDASLSSAAEATATLPFLAEALRRAAAAAPPTTRGARELGAGEHREGEAKGNGDEASSAAEGLAAHEARSIVIGRGGREVRREKIEKCPLALAPPLFFFFFPRSRGRQTTDFHRDVFRRRAAR